MPNYQGRIASISKRGVKAIVEEWQTALFIPNASLAEKGYVWDDGAETWLTGGALKPIQEGERMNVKIVSLKDEAAVCDLEGTVD